MRDASLTARLLAAAIVCCVLDGAVRKWVLSSAPPVIQAIPYFAKDVFILAAAVVGGRVGAASARLRGFGTLSTMFSAIVLLGAAVNFADLRLVGAIVSFRTMVLYPLLAIPIAKGLRSPASILLIVRTISVLVVLNASLGAVQFYLPADHALNSQVQEDLVSHTTDLSDVARTRANGTFSFISGMGDSAIVGAWAGCILVLLNYQRLGFTTLASGFACALASMSRYGFLFAAVVTVGMLFSARRFGLAVGLVVGLGLLATLSGNDLLTGLFVRHASSDRFDDRFSAQVQIFLAINEVPFGEGFGSTQAAERARAGQLSTAVYEAELARVVVEVGVIGLIGVVAARVMWLHLIWSGTRNSGAKSRFGATVCQAGFWAALAFFLHGPAFNHISTTFLCAISAASIGAMLAPSGREIY